MKEYTITYRLTPEHEAALQAMADDNREAGFSCDTVEKVFKLVMGSGSRWDIDDKIAIWQELHENGKRNRAKAVNGEDGKGEQT